MAEVKNNLEHSPENDALHAQEILRKEKQNAEWQPVPERKSPETKLDASMGNAFSDAGKKELTQEAQAGAVEVSPDQKKHQESLEHMLNTLSGNKKILSEDKSSTAAEELQDMLNEGVADESQGQTL